MSEGSKLRRAIYTRMEETSFRSGAALAAAVLAVCGLGIALTVTLGGGHGAAAAPRTTPASTTPSSAAPLLSAPAVPSPSASASATQDPPQPVPAAGRRAPAPDDAAAVPEGFPGLVLPVADAQAAHARTEPGSAQPTAGVAPGVAMAPLVTSRGVSGRA